MDNERYKPIPYDHEAALAKDLKNPEFKKAYDELEEEFSVLDTFLSARKHAQMTQEQVADAMHTSRSAVARIESAGRKSKNSPTVDSLRRYATAVGCKLKIELVPID